MKRLYILSFLLLFLGQALHAQPDLDAALLVETQRGEFFQLSVGGKLINPAPADRVSVGDLPSGRHILNIRVLGRGRRAQNITAEVILTRGFESVYVLAPAVPGRTFPLVLRKVEEIPWSRPVPPSGGNEVCRYVMEKPDVDRVLRFMEEEGFDDRRLEIAKGEIKLAGGIMTDDLFLLMKAITFEERRVALAKYAHAYVCDRQRFSRVLDALEFNSSKRELQDFIYKQ
ncbi:DUF4476 domain-containing protein [Rufibacter latericius]|uniref:DUF4476 domain-containing protein n=1 Tax=Rufibacter latericius TaxID=2487040 RepID=A0A3M9MNW8_9BACT|nr:DUF4476 domain-containing protein [Rufibacter latericius]RNI26895.1 DUF4476 domain-containing protein [Rufibacter latericius]